MYKVDDYVFHHSEGLCRVDSIEDINNMEGTPITYYFLTPLFSPHATRVMVPISRAELLLRPPLTKEESTALIELVKHVKPIKLTQKEIRTLQTLAELSKYAHEEIVQIIKGLVLREHLLKKDNKVLPITQRRVLRSAEKLLFDQIAVALDMDREAIDKKFYQLILVNKKK
ncbi:MAG: hypothetical protein GX350_04480 [Erysipelotrichaceae bacterium]|nr:hypothetical protein [Erysipelotrichaceae bacterium]